MGTISSWHVGYGDLSRRASSLSIRRMAIARFAARWRRPTPRRRLRAQADLGEDRANPGQAPRATAAQIGGPRTPGDVRAPGHETEFETTAMPTPTFATEIDKTKVLIASVFLLALGLGCGYYFVRGPDPDSMREILRSPYIYYPMMGLGGVLFLGLSCWVRASCAAAAP
ncbi:hypothetical protein [Lysobacter sp. CA199]|uniref:hypothetical protein n=1 Tax=Lysobacter sp. CA199 TaxID=3455608 RepID=UPI003F8D3548